MAEALEIPVLTPERPRGEAFVSELGALEPDLSVVVAYGHILRPEVLELPPMGSINVHASLLPRHRGAAPPQLAQATCRGTTRSIVAPRTASRKGMPVSKRRS